MDDIFSVILIYSSLNCSENIIFICICKNIMMNKKQRYIYDLIVCVFVGIPSILLSKRNGARVFHKTQPAQTLFVCMS